MTMLLVVAGQIRSVRAAAPGADPLAEALDHLHNLEYEAAEKELAAWLSRHPDDVRALNYRAGLLLQRELFRRELLEAQAYARGGEAFKDDKASGTPPPVKREVLEALGKAEQVAVERLRQNPRDQDALYWAGVGHVTQALYNLTLEKAGLKALREAKEARELHTELLRLNPEFVDAYLVVGTYDYIVGSLPWYMKVLASLTGHRGNRERGLAQIQRVAQEGHWARADAQLYLAILLYREKRYPEALALYQELARSYPRNFVIPQQIARIHKAQNNWAAAARTYESLLAQYERQAGWSGLFPLAKILYQAGEARAQLGEKEAALRHYEGAARLGGGNIYVYRAELAAAGICLELDRRAEAVRKYQRVVQAVPHTNEGKSAMRQLRLLQPASPGSG
jgi:tetratricopeptide (TPR) repeat protein